MKTECSPGPRIHAQNPNILLLNLFQLRRGEKSLFLYPQKTYSSSGIPSHTFLKLRVRRHEAISEIKSCSIKKIQSDFNLTLLIEDETKYQWSVYFWLCLIIDFDKTEPAQTLESYCIICPSLCLYAKGCYGASMHQQDLYSFLISLDEEWSQWVSKIMLN